MLTNVGIHAPNLTASEFWEDMNDGTARERYETLTLGDITYHNDQATLM